MQDLSALKAVLLAEIGCDKERSIKNKAQQMAEEGSGVDAEGTHSGAREAAGRLRKAQQEMMESVHGMAQRLAIDGEMCPGNGMGGRIQEANSHLNRPGSTSAERIVRRLKRDAADIARDLAAGKYRSARAAGIFFCRTSAGRRE
jgi:hypothetical protein